MAGHRQFASHEDYVKLEAHIEAGMSVEQGAKLIGLPIGAFKSRNGDREWFEQIKAMEGTVRAAMVDDLIDRRVKSGEAGDALIKAWGARNHPAGYRDKTELEVTGKIEHEHHGRFDIGTLAVLAAERGIIDARPVRAVAAAPEILPGPAERAASDLPAAELP